MPQPSTEQPELAHHVSPLDAAAALIKHLGLREGRFELSVEFKIAVGGVGPEGGQRLPGVAIGVSRLGLQPVEAPKGIDAAQINPAPRRTRSAAAG